MDHGNRRNLFKMMNNEDNKMLPLGFKIITGVIVSSNLGTLILMLGGYITDENFPHKNIIFSVTFIITWLLWYSGYRNLTRQK